VSSYQDGCSAAALRGQYMCGTRRLRVDWLLQLVSSADALGASIELQPCP
jgi:hypothetical protein